MSKKTVKVDGVDAETLCMMCGVYYAEADYWRTRIDRFRKGGWIRFPFSALEKHEILLKLLLPQAGVYAFFEGTRLVYIGYTRSLRARLYDHWAGRSTPLRIPIRSRLVCACRKERKRYSGLMAEARLIARLSPSLNRKIG